MSEQFQSIKKVFTHTAIEVKIVDHSWHGTAVFVIFPLTKLWCRIQNDHYELLWHLKRVYLSWSQQNKTKGKEQIHAEWKFIWACTGRHFIAMWHCSEAKLFLLLFCRWWKLQSFCVELRSYKMREYCTALPGLGLVSQRVGLMSVLVLISNSWGTQTSSEKI